MTRIPNNEEMKMPEEQFGNFTSEETSSHLGIILGVLIVVLMLILGGLYLWSTTLQQEVPPIMNPSNQLPTAQENNEPESNNAEADVQTLETLSTSDEIDAMNADIESTNTQTLDADLIILDNLIR